MKTVWKNRGNTFMPDEISSQYDTLPIGIYKLMPTMVGFMLVMIAERFEFPYEIYDLQSKFINRVKKTYANTEGNLGVLCNGLKGTGKTLTMKQIANELNLPIIIIPEAYPGLAHFLNELQQDVGVFVDEYEKIYKDYDNSILTVMDGVMNSSHRKVFLLTTNFLHVNENMLQRPGRIRYIRKFDGLEREVIVKIVNDHLVHKQFTEQTIEFLASLECLTIDTVKAVIQEVNIHEEEPSEFKDVFNVTQISTEYDIYKITKAKPRKGSKLGKIKEELILQNVEVTPNIPISKREIDQWIKFDGLYMGTIARVNRDGTLTINCREEWDDNDGTRKPKQETYRLSRAISYNTAFDGYYSRYGTLYGGLANDHSQDDDDDIEEDVVEMEEVDLVNILK